MLPYKEYYMPRSMEELFRFMEGNERSFDIISGGTDRFVREKDPSKYAELAIDVSVIPELSGITFENGGITFGANTRIQQFLTVPELIDRVPILRHAASYFADQQIREVATVGGNLANASPTGDMIPPLLALDATVHTLMNGGSERGGRDIPVARFIQGVGKTPLLRGEVIASVSCPVLRGYGCAFKKVGQRRSLCISTVNSAFLVKADPAGTRFEDVRIAFGGIAPVPIRLTAVEERLKGAPISKDIIHSMVGLIPEDAVQSRSRREYRKLVIQNFLLAGLYESLAEINILPE